VDNNNLITKGAATRNKLVRQAMNYAINKKQLMMYMRNSIGIPAQAGFVPAGLPSNNVDFVKGYNYNPAKARELLAAAGYPGGKGLPTTKLLTVAIYADIASFAAKQMEESRDSGTSRSDSKKFTLGTNSKICGIIFSSQLDCRLSRRRKLYGYVL